MKDFTFNVPQDIIFGKGSLKRLPELLEKSGSKKMLLISGPVLKKIGMVEKVEEIVKASGIEVEVFTDVEANPSVATVDKATEAYKKAGATSIVAFGGGSPMDVAKAVGVLAKYGGEIGDYEGAHKVPGPIVPIIAIPTTAGTGSEVTAFSVITDEARNYKLTVFSYELIPSYALLDPELVMTSPASVAAACGVDALIHAWEAYTSRDASPFSDAMAEKAMELIGANLRRFVANRQDEEAAAAMLSRKPVRRYRICMGKTWKYPCYEPSGKRLFPCGTRCGKCRFFFQRLWNIMHLQIMDVMRRFTIISAKKKTR